MSRRLRIGCCGLPVGLARYAKTFSIAEVQQTFYQPPTLNTLETWRSKVPADFEFTLKAWQLITHESSRPTYRRLREPLTESAKGEAGAFRWNATVGAAWERTRACARVLRSRIILFQCPARFTPTNEHKANLRKFFGEIRRLARRDDNDQQLTYVWEPRGGPISEGHSPQCRLHRPNPQWECNCLANSELQQKKQS